MNEKFDENCLAILENNFLSENYNIVYKILLYFENNGCDTKNKYLNSKFFYVFNFIMN
jgi:hypothetical protein